MSAEPLGYIVIDKDGTVCTDQATTISNAGAIRDDCEDDDMNGIYGPYRICAVTPVKGEQ